MKLKVYGSGSSGNCYTLTDNQGHVLILDAGINPKHIMRDILATNTIDGVLITHIHGDHSHYSKVYRDQYVKVVMPEELGRDLRDTQSLSENVIYALGNYSVLALKMNHDVDCYGFAIFHKELKSMMLYATDTNGIKYQFEELSTAIIEANYDEHILQDNVSQGIVDVSRANRTRNTHNSIESAIQFIDKNIKRVNSVVLVHLSRDNSNSESFRERMIRETGIPTYIARKGLEVEII